MKKLFIFAVTAAALAACSSEELNVQDTQKPVSQEAPVQFDVYAQRSVTRGGGQTGDLTNANIGTNGFGIFAYYTAGEQYNTNAKPNFMYNQQVTCEGTATAGTLWKYEPVKYWPNEYGNAAQSDEIDYVTFFAYAPWTKIEPSTGEVDVTGITDEAKKTKAQNYNIISVNKNTATGDPIIKYVVDTDPATSVDLLWGVAAQNATDVYTAIDSKNTSASNASIVPKPGLPFLSLVKPNNPASDRLMFNLKHALAKVKITIDYISDVETPKDGTYGSGASTYDSGTTPSPASQTIDQNSTRIFIRSFTMSGFATKGALNLNNTTPGEPLWKDYDGVKDLSFSNSVTFFDGRKDGKEGDVNGAQNNETPVGLNEEIIENYASTSTDTNGKIVFGTDKKTGVKQYTGNTDESQLLFGGASGNEGYFYVIPRNEKTGSNVDMTIVYDIETIDSQLAGLLSDGVTHGLSIENVITKEDIFKGIDFEAGKQYVINIHIGMTSVKVEATVTPWVENGETIVNLPDNQVPYVVSDTKTYTYNFTSYASDQTTEYATGTAQSTGTFVGGYAEIEVKTNTITSFVGKKYYILSSAIVSDSFYQLYTYNETTNTLVSTGIYVKLTGKNEVTNS